MEHVHFIYDRGLTSHLNVIQASTKEIYIHKEIGRHRDQDLVICEPKMEVSHSTNQNAGFDHRTDSWCPSWSVADGGYLIAPVNIPDRPYL